MDNVENTKFCPECGEKVPEKTKFCGNCGYHFPVEDAATQPNQAESSVPPLTGGFTQPQQESSVPPLTGGFTQPQPGNPYPPTNYQQFAPAQSMKKKGKGGLIALISAIAVLVVAALAIIVGITQGWFGELGGTKSVLELSETKITIEVDEEYVIEVVNYKEIDKPELTVTSSDEDIAVAEVKKDEITIVGIEEGKATITVEAKGCESVNIKVIVEEAASSGGNINNADFALEGTAWNADGMKYYFMDNGTMYLIYESSEDYIKGSYEASVITAEEADEDTSDSGYKISRKLTDYYGEDTPEGVYYRVDVDTELELLYGNEYSASNYSSGYYLIVWTDGNDCAIYDSGWSSLNMGYSDNMKTASELDEYFENAGNSSGGNAAYGSITGINFGPQPNVKETWHAALYQNDNADILIYKKDGQLWGLNESTGATMALTELESGTQITIFAVYEDYLFYGVGSDDQFYSDTTAFYLVDIMNEEVKLVSDDISIKDFVIMNDTIYYTDYSELYKMDFEGNSELLWDYGVYTFEVADDNIYVYDGWDWTVLDAGDGTVKETLASSDCDYEADVVRAEDGYLFFTICEYRDDVDGEGLIWLYAMDEDGNVTRIGEGNEGEAWDTYNLVFDGRYAYYTAAGGEMIFKTDVTTGECEQKSLDDSGYYYATGMVMLDDDIVLYAYDNSNKPHYLLLDKDDLTAEEISGTAGQ